MEPRDADHEVFPFQATVQIDLEATDEMHAAEIAWDLVRDIEQDLRVTNVQVDSVN
jgi:predicted RNA-binding protein with RPS1 domain